MAPGLGAMQARRFSTIGSRERCHPRFKRSGMKPTKSHFRIGLIPGQRPQSSSTYPVHNQYATGGRVGAQHASPRLNHLLIEFMISSVLLQKKWSEIIIIELRANLTGLLEELKTKFRLIHVSNCSLGSFRVSDRDCCRRHSDCFYIRALASSISFANFLCNLSEPSLVCCLSWRGYKKCCANCKRNGNNLLHLLLILLIAKSF